MINKKKWLIISSVGIILCGVILYLVTPRKQTYSDINIQLDKTSDFTTDELNQGVEVVINFFNTNWQGSTLKAIEFDDNLYQNEIATKDEGARSFSDYSKYNILIFTTYFKTGSKTDGSVSPHTEMGPWQFILIRQNKNSSWQVIDQGV